MRQTILGLTVVALLMAGVAVMAPSSEVAWATSFCEGENLEGTGGGDNLVGSECVDIIAGKGGDDLIRGLNSPDYLRGNAGEDVVYGGGEDDQMRGGDGRDRVYGGRGDDFISNISDGERDLVDCGPGTDTVNRKPGDTGPADVYRDCERTTQ